MNLYMFLMLCEAIIITFIVYKMLTAYICEMTIPLYRSLSEIRNQLCVQEIEHKEQLEIFKYFKEQTDKLNKKKK